MACEVDSRFRGNDWTREAPSLANDTSTNARALGQKIADPWLPLAVATRSGNMQGRSVVSVSVWFHHDFHVLIERHEEA